MQVWWWKTSLTSVLSYGTQKPIIPWNLWWVVYIFSLFYIVSKLKPDMVFYHVYNKKKDNTIIHQCWSESGLGLGLNGWVRVRTPDWLYPCGLGLGLGLGLHLRRWTRTLISWTRTRTRTPPKWTRTHSEPRWVRWEMYNANLNFHVQ